MTRVLILLAPVLLGPVLVAGLLAMGLPSPFYVLDDGLTWICSLSAVRGAGFAVLTVLGATLSARVAPPERRGESVGMYGLGIAPNGDVLVANEQMLGVLIPSGNLAEWDREYTWTGPTPWRFKRFVTLIFQRRFFRNESAASGTLPEMFSPSRK